MTRRVTGSGRLAPLGPTSVLRTQRRRDVVRGTELVPNQMSKFLWLVPGSNHASLDTRPDRLQYFLVLFLVRNCTVLYITNLKTFRTVR